MENSRLWLVSLVLRHQSITCTGKQQQVTWIMNRCEPWKAVSCVLRKEWKPLFLQFIDSRLPVNGVDEENLVRSFLIAEAITVLACRWHTCSHLHLQVYFCSCFFFLPVEGKDWPGSEAFKMLNLQPCCCMWQCVFVYFSSPMYRFDLMLIIMLFNNVTYFLCYITYFNLQRANSQHMQCKTDALT